MEEWVNHLVTEPKVWIWVLFCLTQQLHPAESHPSAWKTKKVAGHDAVTSLSCTLQLQKLAWLNPGNLIDDFVFAPAVPWVRWWMQRSTAAFLWAIPAQQHVTYTALPPKGVALCCWQKGLKSFEWLFCQHRLGTNALWVYQFIVDLWR